MAAPQNMQLSAVATQHFQEGISLVLSKWSALQLAVENEWGGRNSRNIAAQLASDIFNWFHHLKGEVYIDDLEELLHEALLSLNTVAEDGSIGEVATDLAIMHDECLNENYESVQILRAAAGEAVRVCHVRQAADDEEDDDDEDDVENNDTSNMMVDAPESNTSHSQAGKHQPSRRMEEDEDGWVTVPSKKGKGRKN